MKKATPCKSIGQLAAEFMVNTVNKGQEHANAVITKYVRGVTRTQLEDYVIKMIMPAAYYIAKMQDKDKTK